MTYINRHIESKLKQLLHSFPSLAITGPRQSGKSTLLTNTLKSYNYISLDDPMTREQAISDPQFFLDSAGEKTIIDEIQYAPQLLSYVKIIFFNHSKV
ncbi:MAG: AAA family ATPase [Deltaproteobacteria bacterium]|nr:AAA family ATPase [Deltaproteobacteria bacterium]